MKKHVIGIDFGTTNTLIWMDNSDSVIFNEPSVLTWKKDSHQIVEIGYLAHKLIGKVPQELDIVKPIKNGVIADIEASTAYLKEAFKNLAIKKGYKKATLIFSAPSDLTKVEEAAFIQVAKNIGAREVRIEDGARLSALGSGIDLYSTRGNMIVNIGSDKTNIACIALGKIVIANSSPLAGQTTDEAIARFIRTKHHLIIGEKTSEYIKMKIGTLLENPDNNLLEISGKDALTGTPNSIVISTLEIQEVIKKIYLEISNVIIDTLEITPPEISSDIIHGGITFTGGGCLLNGCREFFQKHLSVPVHITSLPLESVIQGIRILYNESNKQNQ